MKKRAIAIVTVGLLLAAHTDFSSTKTIFTLAELKSIKQPQSHSADVTKTTSATTLGELSSNAFLPPHANDLWWQLFPTTGLRTTNPSLPPLYPYLPHAYHLLELAPNLGKGIAVTLIDTGVFGFTFSTTTQTFVKHPDLTIIGDFLHEPHNTIPFAGKNSDPFKNLAIFTMHHTKKNLRDIKKVYQLLPGWILEYLTAKTTIALDLYLQENGSPELFERNILFFLSQKKLLSAEGKRVKNTLLFGDHGFTRFTIATLESGQKVVAECIPMVSLASPRTAMTDHATHIASIIGAKPKPTSLNSGAELCNFCRGLYGLAPECSLRVIKALYEGHETTTDVKHVTHAFERAIDYQTDIINLSLKLDDTIDPHDPLFKKLEKILTTFPYACCATGNEGTKKPGRMSYPARFKNVPFSVGSFGCLYDKKTNRYTCHLSNFNEYEKGIGPNFIAPGENILGCSYAYANKEPLYALKTGTSCATAFMSGALALILGEFKHDFSSEQLLAVCQASCFKLHDTKEWKEQVVYGVLDIRTALFTLYVLKKLKTLLSSKTFEKQFPSLLATIHQKLFALPATYAKEQGIMYSFKESFIDYYNASLTKSKEKTDKVNAETLTLLPIHFKKQLTIQLTEAIDTMTAEVIAKNSFPSSQ